MGLECIYVHVFIDQQKGPTACEQLARAVRVPRIPRILVLPEVHHAGVVLAPQAVYLVIPSRLALHTRENSGTCFVRAMCCVFSRHA